MTKIQLDQHPGNTVEGRLDYFDMVRGGMDMRNEATKTRVATIQNVDPLVGNVSTYIIETVRVRDEGDWAFIQVATKDGNVRVGLPPKPTKTLARQRESLTTKVRKRIGRQQAAERKAQGIEPFGGKQFKRTRTA